jgi:hypothetical protein
MAFGPGLAIWNTSLQTRVPKVRLAELNFAGIFRPRPRRRLLGLDEGLFRQPGKVYHSRSPFLAVRTKVGHGFPEATLSVRRREALAEAIDFVHDRYWSDLEQLGSEDASLSDLR